MRRPLLFVSFCLVALLALGYCRWTVCGGDGPPDGTHILVTGQVCDKDETSFDLKILSFYFSEIQENAATLQQDDSNLFQSIYGQLNHCGKLICVSDDSQMLQLGAEVVLEGNFESFEPATNPGEFDFAKYYHSIGYLGRLQNVEVIEKCGEDKVREWLYELRCQWKQRIYFVFPQKEASIMAAMLLGDKRDVDTELKALYQRNGIVHILSISGLHITIIGMGIYKLLRKIGCPVWVACVCGGMVLVGYGIMTGFGVSVCRAISMYLIRMLALLVGRTYDMLTALGVVGSVMVLVHPSLLGHMGYLLSFGSVLGLGLLVPALTGRREEATPVKPKRFVEGKLQRMVTQAWQFVCSVFREGMLAGLSITLTTLPVQLWFSYEFSIYSVLLNALILPLMSIVMVSGLMAMLVPGLGMVGTVDVVILAGYEGLCHVFEKLPAAMWNPGRPAVWQIVIYYLIWMVVVWVLPRLKWQKEKIRFVKGMQIVLLLLAVGVLVLPHFRGDRITFLDVGQGDCICVQLSGGEVYLFDCGSSSQKEVGEDVLIPYLKYCGISKVDAVFASHGDADHTNGLEELLSLAKESHIEIGQLVLPDVDKQILYEEFGKLIDVAESEAIPIQVIAAGESWSQGEDSFRCLHPSKDYEAIGGNGDSECFYVKLREGKQEMSLLLTGDVEKTGEEALIAQLKQFGIGEVTVLKVAHHGSKYSTSEAFLDIAKPQVAVISCGKRNTYGHPHEETVGRLIAAGAQIVSTPEYGALTFEIGKEVKGYGFRNFIP